MPARQSNLSSPRYGYDFVLAVTQASINATMREYLSGLDQPATNTCYVEGDVANTYKEISYEQLTASLNGADPFSVPDGTEVKTNPILSVLDKQNFICAIRLQPGLPPLDVYDSTQLNILELGQTSTNVRYNALCRTFQIIGMDVSRRGTTWYNIAQDPADPWIWQTNVNLRMDHIDNLDKLPTAVKAEVEKMVTNLSATGFSVQQLLVDLDTAALTSTMPSFTKSIADPAGTILLTTFRDKYFASMKQQGKPVLHYQAVQRDAEPSDFRATAMLMDVNRRRDDHNVVIQNPTPAQAELSTLNYYCASFLHPLPSPVQFDFNWIGDDESADDGVIALNRTTLANYFAKSLEADFTKLCLVPHPSIKMTRGYWADESTPPEGTYDFWWETTSSGSTDLQHGKPTITIPSTGDELLTLSYAGSTTSVDNADDGNGGTNNFALTVQVKVEFRIMLDGPAKTLTVKQNGSTRAILEFFYGKENATISKRESVMPYTLSADSDGIILTAPQTGQGTVVELTTPQEEDDPSKPNITTDLPTRAVMRIIFAKIQNVSTPTLNLDMGFLQKLIFPGGKVFAFTNVAFADSGDLVAHLRYRSTM